MFTDNAISNHPSLHLVTGSSQLSVILSPKLSPVIHKKVRLEPLRPITLAFKVPDSTNVSALSQTMTGRFSGDKIGFLDMLKLNSALDSA